MVDKQAQARWGERVRRLYLPPSELPVFCTLCKVSTTTGLCPVCLRSLEEITNWPRLDDEHRRTVWGRVQTRLVDARESERAARRRVSLRRSAAPVEPLPEPAPADEVVLVADSGAQVVVQEGLVSPLEPQADAVRMPASDAADTGEALPAQADETAAQAPAEDLAPTSPDADQAPSEPDIASAVPLSGTSPSATVATHGLPSAAMVASMAVSAPVLPEPPDAQAETLTYGGVPVDVAAARARQVRLAMAQVVQASLESARRAQAQASPDPEEIKLKPLI
jgi:predicted Fe-S protein YdhL (DUF1289 family)